MQTTPTGIPALFISAPEIARGAGVTVNTVTATLRRAGVMPDAILNAGRMRAPLFAMPRLDALIAVVNGGKVTPPTLEAQT